MRAGGRLQELGDQIEAGGLARAVGTDQGMNGAAADPQVDVSNGGEPSKILRQAAGLDDVLLAHEARVTTLTVAGRHAAAGRVPLLHRGRTCDGQADRTRYQRAPSNGARPRDHAAAAGAETLYCARANLRPPVALPPQPRQCPRRGAAAPSRSRPGGGPHGASRKPAPAWGRPPAFKCAESLRPRFPPKPASFPSARPADGAPSSWS